jgi:hypothetical protein
MASQANEEDPLAADEHYILDGKSLREKLLDVVEQQEEYVRKVMLFSCCFFREQNAGVFLNLNKESDLTSKGFLI